MVLGELARVAAVIAVLSFIRSDAARDRSWGAGADSLATQLRVVGCTEMLEDWSCLVAPDTELLLWVPREKQGLELMSNGARVEASIEYGEQGAHVRFRVDADDRELALISESGAVLLLLPIYLLRYDPRLVSANELRGLGYRSAAEKLILDARYEGTVWDGAYAEGLLARMDIGPTPDRAHVALDLASELYRTLSCPSGQIKALLAACFVTTMRSRNLPLASKYLERVYDVRRVPSEIQTHIPYFDAGLSLERGDLSRALTQIERAVAEATNMRLEKEVIRSEMVHVEILLRLGRLDDALKVIERLRSLSSEEMSPEQLAEVMTNLGYFELIARGPKSDQLRVENSLQEGLRLYRKLGDPVGGAAALAALLRARIERGDAAGSIELMEQLDRVSIDEKSYLLAEKLELRARVLHISGKKEESLAAFQDLRAYGERAEDPRNAWEGAVGAAQALVSLGREEEALVLFDEADSLLDRMFATVPFGGGSDDFISQYGRATRSHLATLLSLKKDGEALELVRRSRMRQLQRLSSTFAVSELPSDQQRLWDGALDQYYGAREELEGVLLTDELIRLAEYNSSEEAKKVKEKYPDLEARRESARRSVRGALDQLINFWNNPKIGAGFSAVPPPAGTVLVAFHPLPDGWAILAQSGDKIFGTTSSTQKILTGADLQKLFTPLDPILAGAEHLTIQAPWALSKLDLRPANYPALPISYSLDLRGHGPVELPKIHRALVVSTGDLQAMSQETSSLVQRLEARGVVVTELSGAAVTRSRLLEELTDRKYDLFHFAGHAASSDADGWESKLLLADGFITSSDVLALRSVPPRIVLSACSSGKPSGGEDAESLGLAQAFALAGASRVVASTTDVWDGVAKDTMDGLYDCEDPTGAACVRAATCEKIMIGECKNPFRLLEAW